MYWAWCSSHMVHCRGNFVHPSTLHSTSCDPAFASILQPLGRFTVQARAQQRGGAS